MRQRLLNTSVLFAMLTSMTLVFAQAAQRNVNLFVHGFPGQMAVFQINGRSYVDVEDLARFISGSVVFSEHEITLTLPSSSQSAPAATDRASRPENSAFSKEFMNAGIEEMSVIREWRSALVNAVQNGYAVTDAFVAGYQSQASTNLRLAFVAISTDADRSAYNLLSNEFDSIQKLSNKILAARKNMNYVPTDALKGDALDQKILNCARSLASMAANGQFLDDGSCS
jgi:hypothetical protein